MKKLALLSISALTISAIYLYAWPRPTCFMRASCWLMSGLGVLFCLGGLRLLRRRASRASAREAGGAGSGRSDAVLGLALIYTGTSRPYTKLLLSHVAVCAGRCAAGRHGGCSRRRFEAQLVGIHGAG